MFLFTKCSIGKVNGWMRASVDVKRDMFEDVGKKIKNKKYITNWSGFILMLYVLYGFGINAILEDIPMKKDDNAKYPPFKITLGIIISIITRYKNSKKIDEKFDDEPFLQRILGFDDGETPSKSTLGRDILRYDSKDVEEVYIRLIRWMRFLGLAIGEGLVLDSTKIAVDGKTYELIGEGVDYVDGKRKKGYKVFALYDAVFDVVIYFNIKPLNDSDCPTLKEYIEKARQILGKNKIKKIYIDRGFYDEDTLVWLKRECGIDFIIRGKSNTAIHKQAVKNAENYEEVVIEHEKEYRPKTDKGKKAKEERDKEKKPVKAAKVKMKMKEIDIEVAIIEDSTELSNNEKLVLLVKELQKLSQLSYTSQEMMDLFKEKYGVAFSNSKNPKITMSKALKNLPAIKCVGKTRCKKYEINDDDIKIRAKLLGENKKEVVNIWITTLSGKTPKEIVEEYRNRFLIETLFRELKSEWDINEFPSTKINAIKSYLFFTFMAYNIVGIFKRSLTPEYHNAGIEKLRTEIFEKLSVVEWHENGFTLRFNSKKYEKRYYEQLQSIHVFIENRRNEINLLNLDT